ncbi:BTAD domain-containing putative transcriptional regulator [Actinoplanes sp. L3-i22]|uniref:BTAD domain-containing putative transcriptional regulator n=1 Tax=Actinoplanes sp. L3-i22 TaxID=2836373 RepID=UPI001C7856C4|nr:BTAD domain-containing putative transcriptional regulator [Actinoplanes sp. L3-i22]BCY06050.1 hypothetical protein L3i22_011380 [Actinoplanes sp. L3-i22]
MEPDPRFELLGTLRAFSGTGAVDLGPAKQRAVLAVLLLHPGKPVPTHRIVDAVWGDDPPENGANVVQKYIAGLRRVLGRERLALTGGGYVLDVAPGALDADVFRAELVRAETERQAGRADEAIAIARDALALWHGDALSGLTGPVFETARQRLADERAGAWELWAGLRLARGDHEAGLVSELTRLTAEFPLREGLRAHLMVALYRAGRQAEALAAFRDAREFYLDEIGAEPGERMQEVHRAILRGELQSPAPLPPVSPAVPAPAPFPGPPGPAMIPQPYRPSDVPHTLPPFAGTFLPPAMMRPHHDGARWAEAAIAAAAALFTCGVAGWIYFLYAAIQRNRWYHYVAAGVYFAAIPWIIFWFEIDPSPIEAENTSTAEGVGTLSWILLWLVAAAHGAILALRPGDTRSARTRRDLARHFAAVNPTTAVQAGIGRPDLLRFFDDGGLVDLNHASPQELTRLPGVTPFEAHRIDMDRYQNGLFREPRELVMRGLLTPGKLRRIESWLVCVPPPYQPAQPPTG